MQQVGLNGVQNAQMYHSNQPSFQENGTTTPPEMKKDGNKKLVGALAALGVLGAAGICVAKAIKGKKSSISALTDGNKSSILALTDGLQEDCRIERAKKLLEQIRENPNDCDKAFYQLRRIVGNKGEEFGEMGDAVHERLVKMLADATNYKKGKH